MIPGVWTRVRGSWSRKATGYTLKATNCREIRGWVQGIALDCVTRPDRPSPPGSATRRRRPPPRGSSGATAASRRRARASIDRSDPGPRRAAKRAPRRRGVRADAAALPPARGRRRRSRRGDRPRPARRGWAGRPGRGAPRRRGRAGRGRAARGDRGDRRAPARIGVGHRVRPDPPRRLRPRRPSIHGGEREQGQAAIAGREAGVAGPADERRDRSTIPPTQRRARALRDRQRQLDAPILDGPAAQEFGVEDRAPVAARREAIDVRQGLGRCGGAAGLEPVDRRLWCGRDLGVAGPRRPDGDAATGQHALDVEGQLRAQAAGQLALEHAPTGCAEDAEGTQREACGARIPEAHGEAVQHHGLGRGAQAEQVGDVAAGEAGRRLVERRQENGARGLAGQDGERRDDRPHDGRLVRRFEATHQGRDAAGVSDLSQGARGGEAHGGLGVLEQPRNRERGVGGSDGAEGLDRALPHHRRQIAELGQQRRRGPGSTAAVQRRRSEHRGRLRAHRLALVAQRPEQGVEAGAGGIEADHAQRRDAEHRLRDRRADRQRRGHARDDLALEAQPQRLALHRRRGIAQGQQQPRGHQVGRVGVESQQRFHAIVIASRRRLVAQRRDDLIELRRPPRPAMALTVGVGAARREHAEERAEERDAGGTTQVHVARG